MIETECIPPMTHELSRGWDQPNSREILIDKTHAVMTRTTFKKLHRYDNSIPSGVYDGKMWAIFVGVWEGSICQKGVYYLRWYGPSDDAEKCTINQREVLFIDA